MEIILATGNMHKKKELEQIFSGHKILIPSDLGVEFDCDETGSTFMENALLKAETLYNLVKRPVLADDSGLCVNALGGAPGIYSARYGSSEDGLVLTDPDRNRLLLKNLDGVTEREAFFVCAMVLFTAPYRVYSVQESFEGRIADSPFGGGGFGYDPVFVDALSGKTAAELTDVEKNRVSHRGKAGRVMNSLLEALV
ncbi:RdgB/HAM1 family non-canonical purine NTP pyrophosphatase [Oceanispirochaeta sp.]|uniref:RdgB/HAM1 family non-canonical purine NTP pyrophosphatase n=1 Tax=Oceanispirochaeta sp. TaxID=2035350 RepID=UPI0026351256|nr:RdgB/HAM1 family non-canonical purine NTP pyrophosphatase [Oceanispirochaeta sp.]MDA3955191.1 RdgB/HAM1 family non-canonical purine NTP pyrophosphatase [Oceanispirochaeta sp.]